MDKQNNTKNHILHMTIDIILNDGIMHATTRNIAKKSNVGIGTINYYYGSKDALISEALNEIISQKATSFFKDSNIAYTKEGLKEYLYKLSLFSLEYKEYISLGLLNYLTNNSYDAERYIIPYIKGCFKDDISMERVKLISIQILSPLQNMLINYNNYIKFMDYSEYNSNQDLLNTINILIDNLLD